MNRFYLVAGLVLCTVVALCRAQESKIIDATQGGNVLGKRGIYGATPAATFTSTATPTNTPTNTPTLTNTPTNTPTSTPTATPTP